MDTTKLGGDQFYQPTGYPPSNVYPPNPQAYSQPPNYYSQPVSGYNQTVPYAQPYGAQYPQNYPPNQPQYSQQAFIPAQPVVVISPIGMMGIADPNIGHKETKTIKFARRARIACIVNMVVDLLILLYIPALLILIVANIFGIFSTTRFNRCLATTYVVYLYLLIILKAILIGLAPFPIIIAVFSVIIIMNAIVSGFFIAFLRRMHELSHSELDKCRLYYYSHRKRCC